MACAFLSAGLPRILDIPWGIAAMIFCGGLILTGLATVLPILPALDTQMVSGYEAGLGAFIGVMAAVVATRFSSSIEYF